jgi:hypothetical protein
VTRNRAEKAINGILDLVGVGVGAGTGKEQGASSSSSGAAMHTDGEAASGGSSAASAPSSHLLQEFFVATLQALGSAGGSNDVGICLDSRGSLRDFLQRTATIHFPFMISFWHCSASRSKHR